MADQDDAQASYWLREARQALSDGHQDAALAAVAQALAAWPGGAWSLTRQIDTPAGRSISVTVQFDAPEAVAAAATWLKRTQEWAGGET